MVAGPLKPKGKIKCSFHWLPQNLCKMLWLTLSNLTWNVVCTLPAFITPQAISVLRWTQISHIPQRSSSLFQGHSKSPTSHEDPRRMVQREQNASNKSKTKTMKLSQGEASYRRQILYGGTPRREASYADMILYGGTPRREASYADMILYGGTPRREASYRQQILYGGTPRREVSYHRHDLIWWDPKERG